MFLDQSIQTRRMHTENSTPHLRCWKVLRFHRTLGFHRALLKNWATYAVCWRLHCSASENAICPQYRICFLNIIRKEEKHPQQWKDPTKKVLSIISAEDQKNLSVMRLRTKYLSAMFCPHWLFIWFQTHIMVFHPDYF